MVCKSHMYSDNIHLHSCNRTWNTFSYQSIQDKPHTFPCYHRKVPKSIPYRLHSNKDSESKRFLEQLPALLAGNSVMQMLQICYLYIWHTIHFKNSYKHYQLSKSSYSQRSLSTYSLFHIFTDFKTWRAYLLRGEVKVGHA